jgi:uncharacterized protein YacL
METYVLDASALIDLHHCLRAGFRKLGMMAQQGQIKIPEGIFRELQRRTDHLSKTIERWSQKNSDCIVRIARVHNLAGELARIERQYGEQIVVEAKTYPGFWHSPAGRKAGDGQLIAVAKILNAVVVSDDRAVRLACMLENIPCIGWTEFARRVTLTQPRLPGIE